MSYNGSGTFVINTSGQPVVTGTVISSTAFNALTADLGTGLSTAITKDGQTTTTAKIPFAQGISAAVASNFAAGTVAAPSIYLSTDTGTGLYRIGANNDGFAISGTKLLDFGSALLGVTGALTVSTTLGVTGTSTLAAINASGQIKTTVVNHGVLIAPSTATSYATVNYQNTGGDLYIGIDSSAAAFGTAGNYGTIIYRPASTGFAISRVGTVDLAISSAGAVTIPGTLAVTGTLSAASIGANAQILMYPGSFNMTVGTGSVANTEKFMVASPGNAYGGIGITDTVDASNFPFITFRNAAGTGIGSISRVTTTNVVAYNTTSDYRLKNNQAPLTGSGEFIDALRPKTWEWAGNGIKAAGFVAHEFAEVSPSSVTGEKDGSREEEYEVSPAIAATTDKDGKELTPAIAAVKATRTVPVYQGMQASSSEVIANLVAELQSLRKRISQLEAA